MNPNIPYGQQLPMQPPQRRHDMPYNQIPPHLRSHPSYQQYYPQPMGPMMPQYPQHYPQNWYPYQPHMHPHHSGRPQYYPSPHPPMPIPPPQHQSQQHHGPLIVSSHPQPHPQHSPRHLQGPPPAYPSHPPSTASTTSIPQIQTPPSRPISTTSVPNVKAEATPPAVTTPNTVPAPRTPTIETVIQEPVLEEVPPRGPFVPPLPWLSVPDQTFPERALRTRKRVMRSSLGTEPVTFPLSDEPAAKTEASQVVTESQQEPNERAVSTPTPTPIPLDVPSDTISTQPITLSSVTAQKPQTTPTQTRATRAALPVVPVVPVFPQSPNMARAHRDSVASTTSKADSKTDVVESAAVVEEGSEQQQETPVVLAPPPPPPTSWAALLRTQNAGASTSVAPSSTVANGLGAPKSETLGDVLSEINVNEIPSKVAFIQPRGLVNTGNMCYMNSILQMLVFCVPFYEFLDRVAKRAPHTFKSETPLIDAMILFMREYSIIDSTNSVDQLRLRLKPEDYERYGDSFIPEYVYNVIKELPRFRDMRRGQQQDAQEFLGFLLEELHEECAHAMRTGTSVSSGTSTPVGSASNFSEVVDNADGGWMEVGHKQKSAITRSSGAIVTESPVTSIFGGKLRSELKISGNKLSVTLEPYQPLQLDIGDPQVNNVIDALKGLTKPESMQGDFQSSRGLKATATKQVFIETLPPVLILHLKRFHYDSTTKRAEKIWKKVGYPLELELPKEVFPTGTRNKFAAHGGPPKYRLIGVIYHHGKNANGGHYTVDIRRQDGREWIRVDDTMIRRIRSEDVAEGGSEEDPKVLAAALQSHKEGKTSGNRFEQIEDGEEDTGTEKQWNQVNGHARSKSTMSVIANGTSTPAKDSSGLHTPRDKYSVKDNKVAYLLFYQRIAT